jgi:murein DD-endopeptidase MepM/ murein hydrolase activator NlpD
LSVALVPVAAADPQSELERIQDEIQALEDQIASAEAEQSSAAQELAAAQEQVQEILGKLSEAQAGVEEVEGKISNEEANLTDLQSQIAQLERDLAETRAEITSTQQDLEVQAVEMYMTASSSVGASMLSFDSATDLQVGLSYSIGIADFSEDMLDGFVALREEEQRQQGTVEGQKVQVVNILTDLEADRVVLQEKLDEVRVLQSQAEEDLVAAQNILNSINQNIQAAEQHKNGLEAESARLEEEIRRLQETSGAGDTSPGVLGWPVNGPVTSSFGWRVHPIFGTQKLHTGVDLGVGYGTPIAAAEDGVVILAGPYGGYGNAVVVDHGGGLSTLYAHQSSIAVGSGQRVSRGEVIGYVGCTGYCTGAHLHFETRENGTPVDPMKYLG